MIKLIYSKIVGTDDHTLEVVRKSFASTLIKAMGMVLGLLLSIFLGRYLGAAGLGIINLGNRIITITILIGLFGMSQVVTKEVAIAVNKNDFKKISSVFKTLLRFNGLLSIFITFILILVSPWISKTIFDEPRLNYPLIILLCVLPFQVISRLYGAGMIGFKKIWQSNLVDRTLSILITGLVLLCFQIYNYPINIINVAFSYALGRFLVFVFITIYWNGKLVTPKYNSPIIFSSLIKTGFPIFWITLSTNLMGSVDLLMLGYFESSNNVGLYSVAASVALLTSFFLQVTNSALAPKIAALYERNQIYEFEKMVQSITKWLILIGFLQLMVFIFFGREILGLWGVEFREGYNILIVLGIGQFINIATGSSGLILVMCGYERVQRNLTVCFLFISLIATYFLLNRYGVLGAAWATCFSLSFLNISQLILTKVKIGVSTIKF